MLGSRRWRISENKAVAEKLTNFLYDCSEKGIGVKSPFYYPDMNSYYKGTPDPLILSTDCFAEIPEKYKGKVGRWKLGERGYEMRFPYVGITFGGALTGCVSTYEFVSRPGWFHEEARDKATEYLRAFDKKRFVFNSLEGLEKAAETVLSRMSEFSEVLASRKPLSQIAQDPTLISEFSRGLKEIPESTRKHLELSKSFKYVADKLLC